MKAEYIIHMPTRLRRELRSIVRRHGLTETELSKQMLTLIIMADKLHQKGESFMVKDEEGNIVALDVFSTKETSK